MLAAFHPNIFPSRERLAEQRGVSLSTIGRYLNQLEDLGLIRRYRRKGTSTLYKLNVRAIARYKPVQAPPSKPRVEAASTNHASTTNDLPF